MSIHNPSSLKKGNSEKEKKLTAITREVTELESLLADLQDSPLKLGSPVKYSPSHARCSPRKNSAQKVSSPVAFKRDLHKDYLSPGKVVKKIDFKSPSKKVPSNGHSVVSPRKAIGESSNTNKLTNCMVKLDASDIAKVLEDGDSESVAPTKPSTPSKVLPVLPVKQVNTVSSHKLSVTKRYSNLGNKSLNSQKSGKDDILKVGIIKMPTSLKELNLSKLDSLAALNISVNSSAEEFNFMTEKSRTSCNEKLDTNDIAAMLENDDEDDDFRPSSTSDIQRVTGSSRRKSDWKLEKYRKGYDDDDIIIIKDYCATPETSTKPPSRKIRNGYGIRTPAASSSKQQKGTVERNKSKPKNNRDSDDDLVIKGDLKSPNKNNKSLKKKGTSTLKKDSQAKKKEASDSTDSSRKSKARRSLLQEATYSIEDCSQSPLRLKLKRNASTAISSNCNDSKDDSDEEPLMKQRKTEASAAKTKDRTAAKTSDTKNDNNGCIPAVAEIKTRSLKPKSTRSTVTAEDEVDESSDDEPPNTLISRKLRRTETDSNSHLRLKLKRNASIAISSNCNDCEDDSDEEPLMKQRKTEASAAKTKNKPAAKASDTKNDNDDYIKERKAQSLKEKSTRSTVTIEDEMDESSDDEPPNTLTSRKLRKTEADSNSETNSHKKSLRSRESLKPSKWRLMDEMTGIASLKSPTRSPITGVKSPNSNSNTPRKQTTPIKHCDSPKFNQLVSSVQKKIGKGKGFPVRRLEEIEKEQETTQKPLKKNGISKSVLSPSKSRSTIDREPSELNESTFSKAKAVESEKIESDSPNGVIKKRSNKENSLRSSPDQCVTKDLTRLSSRKSVQRNSKLPLKVKSAARDEIPPESIKKAKETTEVIENSLDNARIQLMVSAVPKSLPCRDKEFNNIYSFLGRKIEDFAGGCMYISGVPGTGKTATVHAVIRKLQEDVESGDLSPFDFVEINSLRLTEPRQAYTRILQSLTGNKMPSEQALRMLDNKFSGRGRKSTVLLVDELDYLCNRRQDVIYSILEWPMRQGSGVVVLTIANTMDLPERTLKGKVTSRMGLTRLTFQPYTHHQLQEIVMNRLIGNDSFHPDAVQLVARKVAAVSGDARRALDICRRATELVSPTKGESCNTVTIQHVEKAVSQISSGKRILAIKACSTMAQLALRALRDETLRTGIDESNVSHMYKHLLNICALEGVEKPTFGEIQRICTNLESLGLIIAEKGRPDLMRKLSLNVSSDDIHYALNC